MTTRLRPAAILVALALFSLTAAPSGAAPTRQSVAEQLDRLEEELSSVDEQYNQARIELQKVQNQIRDAERRKAEADSKLGALKGQVSSQSVALYRAGLPKVINALLTSSSISDFHRRVSLISKVAGWEAEVIESLELAQSRADRIREELQQSLDKRTKVERSLAVKKGVLERREAEQRALLARFDAPRPRAPVAAPALTDLPVSGRARIAIEVAYSLLGKPYRYAGSGPDSFDCSGFTMYVWGKAGVSLPHSSRAQYGATPRVAREALQPGDLVFYYQPIHHVALYIGDGKIIHASTSGEPVKVASINYNPRYTGAGRPGI